MTAPDSASAEWGAAAEILRCVRCRGRIRVEGPEGCSCSSCGAVYPIEGGTLRMLPESLQSDEGEGDAAVKRRTAASFAYEWEAFGDRRAEWRRNFLDYMQPHPPEFFRGIKLLDVGTGSGRHAAEAAELGAEVIAADIGDSIDVARRNLPSSAMTVQADAESLPFAPGSFDFVMSIGVLHHLSDPGRALRGLVPYVRPGGLLHVYLYWQPARRSHRLALRLVSWARRITTRMPHRLLHAACYPLAAALFVAVVLPHRIARRVPPLARLTDALPLKAYTEYPFGVLLNDQFDRFSAPIERRFTREQAERLMRDAGLVDVAVLPNNGWVCEGRRPSRAAIPRGVDARDRLPVTVRAVAAQGPTTPGFRIRVLQLAPSLALQGVSIEPELLFTEAEASRFLDAGLWSRTTETLSSRRRLLSRLEADEDADLTLIQRQADMLPSLRVERAASSDRPLVWDVDDAIWHDTSPEARRHPLALLKGTRRKVDWLAKRADHVIAGNEILAEWLSDRSDRITVVPSLVETERVPVKAHADRETITLGWIGSPATARYLSRLREVIARLKGGRPGLALRLLVVGGEIEPIDGIEIVQVPWSQAAEIDALGKMDIGVMPLPDAPWTRGKCSYKALQYMAAGVPAVGDDVGITRKVVGDGGVIVRDAEEWAEAIGELAGDAAMRTRMGAAGRRRVEEGYSVARWAPVVAEILRTAR